MRSPAKNGRRRPRRPAGPGRVLLVNKPFGMLSQFTGDGSANRTLADLGLPDDVWPVGRLDADSEGLLLLCSGRSLTAELLDPEVGHPREYWAQVERVPDEEALGQLETGVEIKGHRTRPARARLIDDPGLPPRDPPIRERKSVPTAWLSLELTEGKNRQVRRMTAAVGHPTLRLHRARIGAFTLTGVEPGAWREANDDEVAALRSAPPPPRAAS